MTDQEYKEQCAALLAEVQDIGKRAAELLAEIRREREQVPCGCLHDKTPCLSKDEEGWVCSLPKGHEGNHMACGGRMYHDLRQWPNTFPASSNPLLPGADCTAIRASVVEPGGDAVNLKGAE